VRALLAATVAVLPGMAGAFDSCICLTCLMGRENFRAGAASMAPTLQAGDCVTMARGNVPQPDRGDLVAVRSDPMAPVIIYRVLGLPGDRIAMEAGIVILNGAPLPQGDPAPWDGDPGLVADCGLIPDSPADCRALSLTERLPNGLAWRILNATDAGSLDSLAEVTVPPDRLFVLGDNRDNSNDSRVPSAAGGPGMVFMGDVIAIRRWTLDDR
jgi:signal peptidase I